MNMIFVESYVTNQIYRQGLRPHGLPPPLIKPTAVVESLPSPPKNPPPPQNRCRRWLEFAVCFA
jgi:hypothetical protein